MSSNETSYKLESSSLLWLTMEWTVCSVSWYNKLAKPSIAPHSIYDQTLFDNGDYFN